MILVCLGFGFEKAKTRNKRLKSTALPPSKNYFWGQPLNSCYQLVSQRNIANAKGRWQNKLPAPCIMT